ncbi:MAG: Fur family transcriptional regulator [Chloroflexota bacterium]
MSSGPLVRSRQAPPWDRVPERLRQRGLRWTLQRATLLAVLEATEGHVTGSQLVEKCREIEPATTPSTVYRTLDVLESIGIISHSHGLDGREEFHVRPVAVHGHLVCTDCGSDEELLAAEAGPFLQALVDAHRFEAHVDHLTVMGRCRDCIDTATGTSPSQTRAAAEAD